MNFLGIDIGSSSVKVAVIDGETGKHLGKSQFPENELAIISKEATWAEQDPDTWWSSLLGALEGLKQSVNLSNVKAVGISYQMHGMVAVDENQQVVRPSIIWCDSRAVDIGEKAFQGIGEDKCLAQLLNSPGNFTASKLAWVKENEPEIYKKIKKVMLPGDFIAMKLSGEINTTQTGLSEGIFWDFEKRSVSKEIMKFFEFPEDILPSVVPTIGQQAKVLPDIARKLGIHEEARITYRAGDQPNNALSLNVFEPGEIATTAGTSAVIYGVASENRFDKSQRVNTFLHVNDSPDQPRNGILLCVNGSGILYNWIRKTFQVNGKLAGYEVLNSLAEKAPIGADGVHFFPFGNGAERVLGNKNLFAHLWNVNFNLHDNTHVIRAAQEGIVFAMNYGLEVLKSMGIPITVMKAGAANLFQSELFRQAFVNTTGTPLELFETDGAEGAARAAGVGLDHWTRQEAFGSLKKIMSVEPETSKKTQYQQAYAAWKTNLDQLINLK